MKWRPASEDRTNLVPWENLLLYVVGHSDVSLGVKKDGNIFKKEEFNKIVRLGQKVYFYLWYYYLGLEKFKVVCNIVIIINRGVIRNVKFKAKTLEVVFQVD